jgi:hydrogenase maturation protease
MPPAIRVLCLGNDLLADDALGRAAADRLAEVAGRDVEVVYAPSAGFALLDYVTGAGRHLLLIDAIHTGAADPGTIHEFREADLITPAGPSPHYVGLHEVLELARTLDLGAPDDVTVLAVETADEITVGGAMHPLVSAAIPRVCTRALELIESWRRAPAGRS